MNDERVRQEGGPAFPCHFNNDVHGYSQHGMNLRDWFAGQALSGLCARNPGHRVFTTGDYAKAAYEAADAMLLAMNAPPTADVLGSESKMDAVRRYDLDLDKREKVPTGDDYNKVMQILGVYR